MSLASELLEVASKAGAVRERQKADDLRREEEARTALQSSIFDRARLIFDQCLADANEAAGLRSAVRTHRKLAEGRFDCRDFDQYRNLWEMVVLALRENRFTAELYFAQSTETDDLGGRGECTVYTPQVRFSWGGTP